jgi:WD40 repeat protein
MMQANEATQTSNGDTEQGESEVEMDNSGHSPMWLSSRGYRPKETRVLSFREGTIVSEEEKHKRRSMELRERYKQQQKEKMELVKLNIGGWRYTTTKATLTRISSSFFNALMEGDIPSTLDDEGAYFIDREGRYFEPILNFMRTGELIIPKSMSKEAVLHEADFYCVTPVVTALLLQESDACGGKLFNSMLKGADSQVVSLASMENHLLATFQDGSMMGWCWNVEDGWTLEFSGNFRDHSQHSIEKVALFSQGARWFLAVFSHKTLYVWNKQEKLGEVKIKSRTVHSLFFVRKGQNLVAINHIKGKISIVSLASLSLRVLSTSPSAVSSACHDTDHVASYCCSSAIVYQLMIGHNDNTCLQELYRDPNQEEITVIVNKEQRTLFYGTENGTLRRLDFPSSEFGGSCQSTLLLSGHVHPIRELLPLGNRTLVSMCSQGHIRCWNNYDVTQMNSYSCPPSSVLVAPYLLRQQGDRVYIYDVLTGKSLQTAYSVNGAHVTALCVCYDKSFFGGMLLVTAHEDGSLQFWSLGLLSLLLKEQVHQHPSFHRK